MVSSVTDVLFDFIVTFLDYVCKKFYVNKGHKTNLPLPWLSWRKTNKFHHVTVFDSCASRKFICPAIPVLCVIMS